MTIQEREARLEDAVPALQKLVTEHALPLWTSAGWDSVNGGFVEQLHADGTPDLVAPRRTFVQARQIYCFAKAAQFDWHPQAKTTAIAGTEHLLSRIRRNNTEEGFPHITDSAGNVVDARRDTSDHAAILMALAGVFELTRDARFRGEIDNILLLMDRRLRSDHGGFVEGLPQSLPRRLTTHMHMLEAMIALFDATGEPTFQQRAGEFFGLFIANLLDPSSGTLGEYYENDWANIQPVQVAPGHIAQWVWLLRGFERVTGCPTARHRSLLMSTLSRHIDPKLDFLVDGSDRDGSITRSTYSFETQASLIKAYIAQAEANEAGATDAARSAINRLQRYYLSHPVFGGWHTRLSEDGNAECDPISAVDLYHVVSVTSEALQVLKA